MNTLLESCLAHLQALVAFDTQNQSGNADAGRLFEYVKQYLPGFHIEQRGTAEQGDLTLHAYRGAPKTLVNIHVDTVPAGSGWIADPLALQVSSDRAVGLGACDIKGALACWLTALEAGPSDQGAGLLLCSDEEAGGSRGVRAFLQQAPAAYQLALIAEPTQCQAVTAHRGYASAKVSFAGKAGHSSEPRALQDNSIHQASRFLNAAQALASRYLQQSHPLYPSLSGICLNAGSISGGLKNNIIAEYTQLSFGCRPLPGQSAGNLLNEIKALADAENIINWQILAADPALPADTDSPDANGLLQQLGLSIAKPVSFWTEASLFSATGIPSAVYGPGDIAQAHTADEWVALSQLEQMTMQYLQLLSGASK